MAQDTQDFAALARRYWEAWGEALRGAAPPAPAAGDGFAGLLQQWQRQLAGLGWQDPFASTAHAAAQGGDWLARMQQVAAQFAGRDPGADEVAAAWRRALGDPMRELLQGMRGPGLADWQGWSEALAPWLQGLGREAQAWLALPAFGFTREHQERLQALARAQLQWQDALRTWQGLLGQASEDAFARFEAKLREHAAPGRQLTRVRELFDLWVDAAEEAYAQMALSPEYRDAYGALVNAQMELRSRAQAIAEAQANLLGLPTRTELDAAHRKIADLQRALRRLQAQRGEAATPAAAPAAPSRRAPSSPSSAQAEPAPARTRKVAKAAKPKRSARTPAPDAASRRRRSPRA